MNSTDDDENANDSTTTTTTTTTTKPSNSDERRNQLTIVEQQLKDCTDEAEKVVLARTIAELLQEMEYFGTTTTETTPRHVAEPLQEMEYIGTTTTTETTPRHETDFFVDKKENAKLDIMHMYEDRDQIPSQRPCPDLSSDLHHDSKPGVFCRHDLCNQKLSPCPLCKFPCCAKESGRNLPRARDHTASVEFTLVCAAVFRDPWKQPILPRLNCTYSQFETVTRVASYPAVGLGSFEELLGIVTLAATTYFCAPYESVKQCVIGHLSEVHGFMSHLPGWWESPHTLKNHERSVIATARFLSHSLPVHAVPPLTKDRADAILHFGDHKIQIRGKIVEEKFLSDSGWAQYINVVSTNLTQTFTILELLRNAFAHNQVSGCDKEFNPVLDTKVPVKWIYLWNVKTNPRRVTSELFIQPQHLNMLTAWLYLGLK